MTYLQIETQLTEQGFKLDFGTSPLKGMRFKNKDQYAFVFVVKDESRISGIKHQVEYYGQAAKA